MGVTNTMVTQNHGELQVVVGNSTHASDEALVQGITDLANGAYNHSLIGLPGAAPHNRLSPDEVRERLARGDAGLEANRVLLLALRRGKAVGVISCTYQPPWTATDCGHWGLLAVDVAEQGTGIASALVRAAEDRLAARGCSSVQIEYEYSPDHAHSLRLESWYEGKLGFSRKYGWLVNRLIGSVVSRRGGGMFTGNEFRQAQKALEIR